MSLIKRVNSILIRDGTFPLKKYLGYAILQSGLEMVVSNVYDVKYSLKIPVLVITPVKVKFRTPKISIVLLAMDTQ